MSKGLKTLSLLLIPAIWISLMVSLVVRAQDRKPLDYLSTRNQIYDPALGVTWYSLRREGVLIGYSRSSLDYADNTEDEYQQNEDTVVSLDSLGTPAVLSISWQNRLSASLQPLSVSGRVKLGSLEFQVQGRREGDSLNLSIQGLGSDLNRTVRSDTDISTPFTIYPIVAAKNSKPGQTYKFLTFDALTQAETTMTLIYRDTSLLPTLNGVVEARHFTCQMSGLSSEVYLDAKGTLLREESSNYITELVDFAEIKNLYQDYNRENFPSPQGR